MKTNFVIADEYGRELFKHYCGNESWCKVIKESKDEFSPWDISYFSGSTIIIGEIKVRKYDSNAFTDWDYEEKKHIALKKILTATKKKHPNKKIEIQYINFFQDEGVKIWTTTNIEQQQEPISQIRPATTFGEQSMIVKRMYKCNLDIESDRGLLTPIIIDVKPDNDDDDDGFPF